MLVAREPKSGLELRAPALRERDSNEPRDGAAAARRLARVTTQPSCEFVGLDVLALPETPDLELGK